jgi:hypothetical protein
MTPEQIQKLQKAVVMLHTVQAIMDDIPTNGLLTHKAKLTFNAARKEVDKVIYDFHKGASNEVVEEYYMQVKQFEAFLLAYANNEVEVIE